MNELLKQSAAAYLALSAYRYHFLLGKKGRQYALALAFPPRGVLAFGRASQDKGRSIQNKKTCARGRPVRQYPRGKNIRRRWSAPRAMALHLRIAGDDRIKRLRVQISRSRVQRLFDPGRIPAHEQADHVLCRRFHACQHIRANGRAARQRAKLPRPDDFTNRTGNHCLRRAHGHLSLGILSGIKQKAEQRLRAFLRAPSPAFVVTSC